MFSVSVNDLHNAVRNVGIEAETDVKGITPRTLQRL